ncbi:hypothetical protein [Hymenobacter sp. UYCo722]|uniref:hypothetical protein n=1 Tax=Hymenobacter sp. UYCo722 TaxID=3156335 RepID=UPI0033987A00
MKYLTFTLGILLIGCSSDDGHRFVGTYKGNRHILTITQGEANNFEVKTVYAGTLDEVSMSTTGHYDSKCKCLKVQKNNRTLEAVLIPKENRLVLTNFGSFTKLDGPEL